MIPINIGAGDQFKPEFLKISPNNKMPAIVDRDGPDGKPISIFESGAILMYLAEKTGKLMPSDTRGKYNVIQWLMFQMGERRPDARPGASLPPLRAREDSSTRSTATPTKPSGFTDVIDKRLGEAKYLAGDYSIADIATYPWLVPHRCRDRSSKIFRI